MSNWLQKAKYFALFVSGLTLVACNADMETAQIVDKDEVATTAVPPTAVATSTLSPTASPTGTVVPTPTATSTATPIPTATITPAPKLANPQPSLADLQEYLVNVPVRFFSEHEQSTFMVEDYFQETPLSPNTEVSYQDLNGDGIDDIIIYELNSPISWGWGRLIVMIWQESGYSDPLLVVGHAKYDPRHRFFLEDWTGDGNREVIYDFQSGTGGPGYIEVARTRYVIHCREQCDVAWSQVTGIQEHYYTVSRKRVTIERIMQDEIPSLSVLTESFHGPLLQDILSDRYDPHFQVLTSTLEFYSWQETRFVLVESQILSEAHDSQFEPVWAATNQFGVEARLTMGFSEPVFGRPIYVCTLHTGNNWAGEPFDCNPGFTVVEWRDITGDGREEIVVTTLAYDKQRLLAFHWHGVEATQIADVAGDIIRSDLFGVALEDVDGDGRLEIVAGKFDWGEPSFCRVYEDIYPDPVEYCWQDWIFAEEIYKWNGVAYSKQD